VTFGVLDRALEYKAKIAEQEFSPAETEPPASPDPNGSIEKPLLQVTREHGEPKKQIPRRGPQGA